MIPTRWERELQEKNVDIIRLEYIFLAPLKIMDKTLINNMHIYILLKLFSSAQELRKLLCLSVCLSIRPSVRPSVRPFYEFFTQLSCFRVSSGSLQGLFRVSSGSFQGLFRVSSGSSGSRQGLIHDLSLAFQTFLYNVFLELGGLPHVLPLAVHLE